MRPTAIALRALYRNLYETLPWPEPIPRAEIVTFLWGPLGRAGVGSCNTEAKIIRVSIVYQDERLRRELHDLMAHEASHFIWAAHSKAFKDFLRGAGTRPVEPRRTTDCSECSRTGQRYARAADSMPLPCLEG